jgi:hypothetical protein
MKWISPRVEPQEGFNDSSLVYEMKGSGLSIVGLTYGSIIIHSFSPR